MGALKQQQIDVPYYCERCREELTCGQVVCPFCDHDATPIDDLSIGEAWSRLLDLELERCGWAESNGHFEAMVSALRAKDYPAYDEAKARFEESMQSFPREAGEPNKQPATNK